MTHIINVVFCVFSLVAISDGLRFVSKKFQKPHLQVQTHNGYVQGTRLISDYHRSGYYYAYMGIPYAQPPTGSLRFKAPLMAKNWSGVLDGTHEGSACVGIQMDIVNMSFKTTVTGSEDCLFLNVFTKNNPSKVKRSSPVMVYFYGGAFLSGSSNVTFYGADLLVSEDVIVVTLNYRVGILGFLSTEDMASPGNYGLKDQNMALRWVQQNVKNFGGNPNSVTIFGQSAGSASVHFHVLSPKSKGLFQKAIMESGTALCHWASQRQPRNIAYLTGMANGITNPKDSFDLIERLRKIKLEDLKISSVGTTFAMFGTSIRTGLPTSPSIEPEHESAFISRDYWYELLKHGDFNHVPVLMGITANESLFFHKVIEIVKPFLLGLDVDPSLVAPPALNISNLTVAFQIGQMMAAYYLGPGESFSNIDTYTLMQFVNHEYYIRPIRKTALLMAKHIPVYFYYFSYQGLLGANGIHSLGKHKYTEGVAHEEELMYIFNKLGNVSQRKSDYVVRKGMLKLWTNFAKYGNPTPWKKSILNDLIWPEVSPSEQPKLKYLEINETLTIRNIMNEQLYLDWWEDLFEKYAVSPLRTY